MQGVYNKIGLFGFGCVGHGLYQVLQAAQDAPFLIHKVCIRDATKERPVHDLEFTTDKESLLYDPAIKIIVELTSDPDAALEIVTTALRNGKSVVSANKKMIAEHLPLLQRLQEQYGTSLLYEASSAASIPIIRNLESYFNRDNILCIQGILNGSTNYILHRMFTEQCTYAAAFAEALQSGFLEADSDNDILGYDSRFKLSILSAHAFGRYISPEQIWCRGIQGITKEDAHFAQRHGYVIKLIAGAKRSAKGIHAYVAPHCIPVGEPLAGVHYADNGIQLESAFAGLQFFKGTGAGGIATGSAVWSDISAVSEGYRYRYAKKQVALPVGIPDVARGPEEEPPLLQDTLLRVYIRYTGGSFIPEELFEEIEEVFTRGATSYCIGTAQISALQHTNILQDDRVCILVLP